MRTESLAATALVLSALAMPALSPADGLPSYLVGRDLPEELVALERDGAIADAEKWIAERIPENPAPDDPLVVERERLTRLRREFSLEPSQLLDALRRDIPDATFADIEAWREGGDLQHATIDGEPRYFRKEPRNLFRVSKAARARRDGAAKPAPAQGDPNAVSTAEFDLHARVRDLLDEAERTGTQTPGAMRIQVRHSIAVDPGAVPEGETVRCWIPFPQEYERQRAVRLIAASHEPTVAPNASPQRTVYQQAPAAPAPEKTEFWIEYEYTISAYVPALDPAVARKADAAAMAEFLADRPPHAALSPELRELSARIVGDETNPLLAADKIFRWIDGNFRYCSEMEYSIVASITDKALVERAGDCGIHALLFVALCRAAGIPARWQSGWAMRPGAENMHDWAEFRVEPWGWLPADPSFGLRADDDPRVRDFYIGRIDPFRMIANLDFDAPFDPPKTHWRSDNIDNQRGEVEWSGGNLYFDRWKWTVKAEYAPVDAGATP